MRTTSTAVRNQPTYFEQAQEERSQSKPGQPGRPDRAPAHNKHSAQAPARPSVRQRADARRAAQEDATTRAVQHRLQDQLPAQNDGQLPGQVDGPSDNRLLNANDRDDALEYLMNELTEEYGRSEEGFNPNHPDFPDYPTATGWESAVRREINDLGHNAWYGPAMEDQDPFELVGSVRDHLEQTYTNASDDALNHATGVIVEELMGARQRWREAGSRESVPPWRRGESPEHGPTEPLVPDQDHLAPQDSWLGDALTWLDTGLTVEGIGSAAIGSSTPTVLGTLTGVIGAPLSIGMGLWGLGRANQEHEHLAARGSERQALIHTLAYLSRNMDGEGALPQIEGLSDRMFSQYGRYDDTGPSGPPDPDAFEQGVQRAHDYLARMSPRQRLSFQAQLQGYAQDPMIGHADETPGLDDYLNAMRYQMGLWDAP